VTAESLQRMADCFASPEELHAFLGDLTGLADEITFTNQLLVRSLDNNDTRMSLLLTMKRMFLFTIFCKENIEVLHDLIAALEYKEIGEARHQDIQKHFPDSTIYEV
jgi:hypothetical protein